MLSPPFLAAAVTPHTLITPIDYFRHCPRTGIGTANVNAEQAWDGCGETSGFSDFSFGQSTEYYPDSRLRRHDVDLRGGGYGGGAATDEATAAVTAPKGYWATGAEAGKWAGDRGQQVPPATEN